MAIHSQHGCSTKRLRTMKPNEIHLIDRNALRQLRELHPNLSQLELAQAGSYMQGVLEKQLCYNATAVRIRADGNLELDTIEGNKKLVVYYRSKGLYLQTTTGAGTGTNPLYLTGIDVSAWRAEKISGRQLRIDFALQGQGVERRFVQLVTCCNGEITDETL